MRVLFFDTETGGLPNYKAGHGEHQPDVLQLVANLYDSETRRRMAGISLLIRSEKEIHPKAQEVHGITLETLETWGVSRRYMVSAFVGIALKADVIVAFNSDFDQRMMANAFTCEKVPVLNPAKFWCAMKACTPITKIPAVGNQIRFGPYKNPKLIEAYKILVDEAGFEGAHDAGIDVDAMVDVYWRLQDQGLTPCRRQTVAA